MYFHYKETLYFTLWNKPIRRIPAFDTSAGDSALFVNESDFFCIMIIGRLPITIFSKDLLHLLLHFRRKMFLSPMYTIIGSTVAQNIHDAVLDGLHFDMFYLVVEMGKTYAALNWYTRMKWEQDAWRLASG